MLKTISYSIVFIPKRFDDIQEKYALNKTENAVHGSDSWMRAHEEICIFFECGKKKEAQVKKEEVKTKEVKVDESKTEELVSATKEDKNNNENNTNK